MYLHSKSDNNIKNKVYVVSLNESDDQYQKQSCDIESYIESNMTPRKQSVSPRKESTHAIPNASQVKKGTSQAAKIKAIKLVFGTDSPFNVDNIDPNVLDLMSVDAISYWGRIYKNLDSAEKFRNSTQSTLSTLGIVDALIMTIAFGGALLSPNSYSSDLQNLEHEILRYVSVVLISLSIFSSVVSLWMAIKQYSLLTRTCDDDLFFVVTGVIKGRWFFEPVKWSRFACGSLCLAYLVAIYLLQGWTLFLCSILLFIAAILGTEILDSDSEKRWQTISFNKKETKLPFSATKGSVAAELFDLEMSRKNFINTARSDIVTARNNTESPRSPIVSARTKPPAVEGSNMNTPRSQESSVEKGDKSTPRGLLTPAENKDTDTPRSQLGSARMKPTARQLYSSNHKLEATM